MANENTIEKTHTITSEFAIPSSALGPQFYNVVLQTIQRKCGTCDDEHGLITNIVSIDEIVDSRISAANCTNYVTVRYSFDAIKPIVGMKLNATVVSLFQEGTFFVYKTFKLITTNGTHVPATFDDVEQYRCGECDATFVKTNVVRVKLTDVNFRDNTFYCICVHNHE